MNSVDSALDRLWHFLTSMKLAMVLMLVFAALGARRARWSSRRLRA